MNRHDDGNTTTPFSCATREPVQYGLLCSGNWMTNTLSITVQTNTLLISETFHGVYRAGRVIAQNAKHCHAHLLCIGW